MSQNVTSIDARIWLGRERLSSVATWAAALLAARSRRPLSAIPARRPRRRALAERALRPVARRPDALPRFHRNQIRPPLSSSTFCRQPWLARSASARTSSFRAACCSRPQPSWRLPPRSRGGRGCSKNSDRRACSGAQPRSCFCPATPSRNGITSRSSPRCPFSRSCPARALSRPVDAPWAILGGLGAGCMICIRPHYALALLPCGLYALHRRGWRDAAWLPEIFSCALVMAIYAAICAVAFPHFFTDVLPIDLAVYVRGGAPLGSLFVRPWSLVWAAGCGRALGNPALARRLVAGAVPGPRVGRRGLRAISCKARAGPTTCMSPTRCCWRRSRSPIGRRSDRPAPEF